MEWSESINRYFPHMAGCPLPIYCTLPIAHCPINVLCIVCVLHKIYQCPKYTLLVIQVLKVIAHYPLNIANCPLHPGNDWSPTERKIRSPSQQQEWISFSRFGCASRPPAAGRDRKLLRVRPHLTQARLIFYLNFFLGFFFTFSLRHTMCIYQPRVCEGRKLIRE